MAYNKNVQKARASVGKDSMELKTEARRRAESVYSKWSPALQGGVRAVYSLLLNRGPQTVPQLEEWIGVNTSGVSKLMNGMKDMGVVKVEKVDESVIAQSMASSKRVDVSNVGPYEDLVVALASISLERSNAEIKGWLRELTGLAERRIREAKVRCPACGAVLETYKVTGLRCPRCRAEADGGTTEVSLAMLGALVKLKEGRA